MAIPQQNQPASFSVANRFPPLPQMQSLKPLDVVALTEWYEALKLVLVRQFTQLTTEIDKKADKS